MFFSRLFMPAIIFAISGLMAIFTVTAPTPASASECMRLWIERNAIFDRRGYCFRSKLGKGYFNNADCSTSAPRLSKSEKRRVGQIKKREKRLGCASAKKRWTVSALRSAANSGSRPAKATPSRRADCSRDLELIFNISGRMEFNERLSISGPSHVGVNTSGAQAFVGAYSGHCVGGRYSYRYTVELDDLGQNSIKSFSGSFRASDQTRRCVFEISESSGSAYVDCN